jgi:hypothetical protein
LWRVEIFRVRILRFFVIMVFVLRGKYADKMSRYKSPLCSRMGLAVLVILILLWSSGTLAKQQGWQRQQVDWRMTGGSRIKAVSYPDQKPLPMAAGRKFSRRTVRKKFLPPEAAVRLEGSGVQSTMPLVAAVIESPP